MILKLDEIKIILTLLPIHKVGFEQVKPVCGAMCSVNEFIVSMFILFCKNTQPYNMYNYVVQ